VSDINTAVVDSLKVLDPKRPIREEKRTSQFKSVMSTIDPDPRTAY
jgi:hypothetical protein